MGATGFFEDIKWVVVGDVLTLEPLNGKEGWYCGGYSLDRGVKGSIRHVKTKGLLHFAGTTLKELFADFSNLRTADLSAFETSQATSMYGMFNRCRFLTDIDLSGFDTRKIIDMRFMFSGCSSLTSLDLSHFDMSKVTDMGYMFHGCGELVNLDLTGLKDFEGKDTSCILDNCDSLSNLSLSENVEKATNDLILLHTILYYTPSSFLLSHERIQVANVLLRYFEEWLNIDLSKEKELLKSITKKEDINGITARKSETHPVKKVQDILEIIWGYGMICEFGEYNPQSLTKNGVMSDINAYLSGVPLEDIFA